MDAKASALRAGQDLTRVWLCVDMDAFFAACEELDNPALVRRLLSDHPVEVRKSSCRPAVGGATLVTRSGVRAAEEQADGGGRHRHVLHGELCGARVRRALGHAGLHRQAAVPRCGPRALPGATCPGDLPRRTGAASRRSHLERALRRAGLREAVL